MSVFVSVPEIAGLVKRPQKGLTCRRLRLQLYYRSVPGDLEIAACPQNRDFVSVLLSHKSVCRHQQPSCRAANSALSRAIRECGSETLVPAGCWRSDEHGSSQAW